MILLLWACVNLLTRFSFAIPGSGVEGRNFVFGFSRAGLRNDIVYSNAIKVTTNEEIVTVNCHKPTLYDRYDKAIKSLRRYETITFPLPKDPVVSDNGIFNAFYLNASGAIRVWLLVDIKIVGGRTSGSDKFTSGINIMPQRSCHKYYFIATSIGHPFIMIFSFDYNDTKVTVDFSLAADTFFNISCQANMLCRPGNKPSFSLKPYQMWNFYVNSNNATLHNTRLKSSKPVFVLAGNYKRNAPKATNRNWNEYLCLSAMTPTKAWGKRYFVPAFNLRDRAIPVYLLINAQKFPIVLSIYSKLTQTHATVFQGTFTKYGNTVDPFMVQSNVSFALHLFVSESTHNKAHLNVGALLINMISIEQWPSGIIFTRRQQQAEIDILNKGVLVTINAENLICEKYVNETFQKCNLKWGKDIVGNTVFHIVFYPLFKYNAFKFYSNSASTKIMIYVISSPDQFVIPWEFYQSHINVRPCRCFMTDSAFRDGIDNDCDGQIDEEVENGLDDDDDGRIDEDVVQAYTDGQWGQWVTVCKRDPKRFRSCNDPLYSRYGKNCKGASLDNSVAVSHCSSSGTIESICSQGCNDCKPESEYPCPSCRIDYTPSRFCRTQCPNGWHGQGCTESSNGSEGIKTRMEQIGSNLNELDGHSWYTYAVHCTVGVVTVTFIVVILVNIYKKIAIKDT